MKKISNRSIGSRFEFTFCEKLFENGWWCHQMTQNFAGQPADIIAAKDDSLYLIDCKDCKNGYFDLTRIEPNQDIAMTMFEERCEGEALFVCRVDGEEYVLPYWKAEQMRNQGVNRISDWSKFMTARSFLWLQ